ncbi:DUF4347 domain-containing protein [Stieleria varia]|uniref:Lectin C-type domain protein n=1 Tax=Stieleria varia TaxID=2528005 RepID=A0A5C6AT99_9BACT|nr:DUF4347 domain-containing protein [Stieleria varia]TWU02788.1 Lectin C-type domain protein [Stieleria varia]
MRSRQPLSAWRSTELERRLMLAGDVSIAVSEPAACDTGSVCTTPLTDIQTTDIHSSDQARELVVVAADVPDLDQLIASIGGRYELAVLDPSRSGFGQLDQLVRQRTGLQALHLITHGDAGRLAIGNEIVSAVDLTTLADSLRQWKDSFDADADILLYGCNVGKTVAGQEFVRELSRLTGTDVAASVDATGAEHMGGDWDLEYAVGVIDTAIAVNDRFAKQYDGLLPIVISAAGQTNTEQIQLQINGETVATFDDLGGDAALGEFVDLTYAADGVSVDSIRVLFSNDQVDPVSGDDRNVRVDKITVDGDDYETESLLVYSTGTWLPSDGIVPGYRESEYLHANGYFQFRSDGSPAGSLIEIDARGQTGDEDLELVIDDEVVQRWTAIGTETTTLSFVAGEPVSASSVSIRFSNDFYDVDSQVDNNLIVDAIRIDGETFETEGAAVYSTGSWSAVDGIVPGFRESEYLNANGELRYFDSVPGDGSTVTIFAAGYQGGEDMSLQIDGRTVASWSNLTTQSAAFSVVSARPIQADSVRVVFTNDQYDPNEGVDANLIVDRIEIDGVVYETESPDVYSTGSWLPSDGIVPGFRESEMLNVNGYFQFAGQAIEGGGELSIESLVSVNEDSGFAIIEVVRGGDLTGSVSVDFAVTSEQSDAYEFGAVSGTLQFVSGQAMGQIAVPLADDLVAEANKSLIVTLSSPSGSATLTQSVGQIKIIDDDQGSLVGRTLFQFNGHLYALTTGEVSWLDAQAEAEAIGGNLVTITDQAEQDWLRATFGPSEFWIGMNDIETEGDFEWVSGEGVTFTNWFPGEPSSVSGDDYAIMNFDPLTGGWKNLSETNTYQGIIEIGSYVNDDPPVPNGSGFVTETIVSGLVQPIAFAEASDGRIFVAEKEGRIKVVQHGEVISTFLDINLEVNSHHDRGMLGIALDPDFLSNGHVYVQYAVELNPDEPDEVDFFTSAGGRLVRYTASELDPNVADESTRVVIQDDHQTTHATHSVGDIDFDNDGNLIFTWGDGGFNDDLRLGSQDPTSRQGKLFRIDPVTFEGVPDNPFYDPDDPSSIASRVWALGVRNSWKLTVDRPTGDVYIGEVTDGGPEEINVMRAQGNTVHNFGWPYYEGDNRTSYGVVPVDFTYDPAFILLEHSESGGGDAILGGAVFRGDAYPELYDGRYFFGNINQGILYSADAGGNFQAFGEAGDYPGIVDIQMGSDGTLWMMSMLTGGIERLVYATPGSGNTDPTALATSNLTAGVEQVDALLTASGSADGDGDPLVYAWDFDSDGVIDALGESVEHVYSTIGRNNTTLLVSDGRGGTDSHLIEIDVLESAPIPSNLALGRPTSQSGAVDGGIGSRAVDGNTDPVFGNGSVTQTLQTRTPLWEVDLGDEYEIASIEIVSDPLGDHELANFWVLVSANPFSSGNLDAVRNDPGIWAYEFTGSASALESISVGALGRHVRIQMAGVNDVLSLVEVSVLEA